MGGGVFTRVVLASPLSKLFVAVADALEASGSGVVRGFTEPDVVSVVLLLAPF